MSYHSKITEKGNSSHSFNSKEEAEYRAKALDDNGCINCVNCLHCVNCIDCESSNNCSDCIGCNQCSNCVSCYGCIRTSEAIRCKKCNDCCFITDEICREDYTGDFIQHSEAWRAWRKKGL